MSKKNKRKKRGGKAWHQMFVWGRYSILMISDGVCETGTVLVVTEVKLPE